MMSTRAKEYLWIITASLLVVLLGSIPLILGYLAQTPELRFIGTIYDRMDYSVQLAMMHYGEQGNWSYQFRFTTEPVSPTYLKTLYVVLGHVDQWLGIPSNIFFQIARLVFGLLACFSIYYLLTRIFITTVERRLAFVLTILGSGLGWLQMPLGFLPDPGLSPIDLWHIDAYIFAEIAALPHLAIISAAMAFSLAIFLNHIQRPRFLNIVIISLCALFVQFINPIAFILVDVAMAGICIFSWWRQGKINWTLAWNLALLAVVQLPLLLYSFILLTRDPAWMIFNRQNITLAPPPIYVLLGFGLLWPFALVGMFKVLRERNTNLAWAMVWVVFAIGMAYLPIAIQRRFLISFTLPLAILVTPIILEFSRWLHQRLRLSELTAAILIATLAMMTPIFLVVSYSADMARRPAEFFEPAALVGAVEWLGAHGESQQVVLAAEPTAQLVAIYTPLKLYFGHAMETLYYTEKAQAVERFYRQGQPLTWLKDQGINWVIFGPHEKSWGEVPPNAPGLQVAYQNDLVTIYKVVAP